MKVLIDGKVKDLHYTVAAKLLKSKKAVAVAKDTPAPLKSRKKIDE